MSPEELRALGQIHQGQFCCHVSTFVHIPAHKSHNMTKVTAVQLAQQRVTQGRSCWPHTVGVKGLEAGALESTLTHTELPNTAAISHLSG